MVLEHLLQTLKNNKDAIIILGTSAATLLGTGVYGGFYLGIAYKRLEQREIREEVAQSSHYHTPHAALHTPSHTSIPLAHTHHAKYQVTHSVGEAKEIRGE